MPQLELEGITKRKMPPRKHKVNINYFKTWSGDMAYILGLWWADGCISRGKNIFDIALHKQDDYLLKDVLKEMDSGYPILYEGNMARFQMSCTVIVADILSLGGSFRKSKTTIFPEVSREYMSDFVRGYFDGDGSIFIDKPRNRYASSISSGSKQFVEGLYRVLQSQVGVGGYSRKRTQKACDNEKLSKDSYWYELSFKYNDTVKLGRYIYQSGSRLRMSRKFDKFKEAMAHPSCTKRF